MTEVHSYINDNSGSHILLIFQVLVPSNTIFHHLNNSESELHKLITNLKAFSSLATLPP